MTEWLGVNQVHESAGGQRRNLQVPVCTLANVYNDKRVVYFVAGASAGNETDLRERERDDCMVSVC